VALERASPSAPRPPYYRWKSKYSGLELSELQRLRQLEDENRRLKHIVAELMLDN
jgi:putative transposase